MGTSDAIAALQASAGNAAVQRLVAQSASADAPAQRQRRPGEDEVTTNQDTGEVARREEN